MKKLVLSLSTVLLTAIVGCAQKEAPAEVQNTFKQKYPGARSVKWEMENSTEWEAEFKMEDKEMSAGFDLKGNWQHTETEIKMKELPAAVSGAIKTQFADYKAEDPEKVEMANGEVAYEVELEKGDEEWEVVFSADGKVINKKQETEDED